MSSNCSVWVVHSLLYAFPFSVVEIFVYIQREYATYMEKKTSKRQMAVVSLSDYNQKQIDDLEQERKTMTEQFDKRKEGVLFLVLVFLLLQGLQPSQSTRHQHQNNCMFIWCAWAVY